MWQTGQEVKAGEQGEMKRKRRATDPAGMRIFGAGRCVHAVGPVILPILLNVLAGLVRCRGVSDVYSGAQDCGARATELDIWVSPPFPTDARRWNPPSTLLHGQAYHEVTGSFHEHAEWLSTRQCQLDKLSCGNGFKRRRCTLPGHLPFCCGGWGRARKGGAIQWVRHSSHVEP